MAHQHYTGTGKMHSFRGLLDNGAQDKIRIQGSVGAIAWRITKFEIFPSLPGTVNIENNVVVWREEQASVSGSAITVDFADDELLAVGMFHDSASYGNTGAQVVVFDNSLFVRNIWITNTDTDGATAINYYIELEEVKVSKAGMAQLAVAAARRLGLNP